MSDSHTQTSANTRSWARDCLHNISRIRNAGHSKFIEIDNGRIRDWTIRQVYMLGKVADAESDGVGGIEITTGLQDTARRLIHRGLVKKVRNNNKDVIVLTERGYATLAEGVALMEQIQDYLLAPLTPAQRADFLSMLNVVSSALDDCEPTQDLSPKRRGRPRSYSGT